MSRVVSGELRKSPTGLITKSLMVIFTLYIMFLIVLNGFVIHEKGTLKYIIIVAPIFIVCIFIANKLNISSKVYLVGIFIIAFTLKAVIVIITNTQPVSDFKTFYDCAVALQNGEKGWSKWAYFSDWAYQTGPITYYAILMKIFGTGLLPLKLCNCFFMAGTNTLIYLFAKKITNEAAACSVALLYMFYPAPYFLAPVLTNQHFAAFMLFLGIYILMLDKVNFAVKGLVGGVIVALGNAVRPLGMVVIIAFVVWGLLELIRTKKIINVG